jgi:hypothetical protein
MSAALPGSCAPNWLQWKADHGEIPVFQFLVQILEAGILRRVAALAGHVHRQGHLAALRRQKIRAAIESLHTEVVKAHPLSFGSNL